MTNDELTERAEEFIRLHECPLGDDKCRDCMANFAALEREAAVREFIDKVDNRLPGSATVHEALGDAFRAMFGKELE
jgi:hypothetical protein